MLVIDIGDTELNEVYHDATKLSDIATTLLKHMRHLFLGLVSAKCLLHRDASRAESLCQYYF
jgi:hypothetical protein